MVLSKGVPHKLACLVRGAVVRGALCVSPCQLVSSGVVPQLSVLCLCTQLGERAVAAVDAAFHVHAN